MALVRWNPIGQLAGMEVDRLNRMFNELYQDNFNRDWTPPVDIYETEGREVVDGVDTRGAKVSRLAQKIGFIFQNPKDKLFAN